ncbi:MAG: RES domain-containing protein [Chloroflexi bacterium]|nr:RES domain-containing protein [Chloroflexota bacterium]
MDATETYAHFALENDTGGTYRRWAFISAGGKAFVQYADDTGWYYPQDLINPVKTNTWYVAILRADDINGFKIDVHERDNPSVSGTYTRPMPTGLSWRFHHWIWRNTSYLANYVERKVNGGTTVYVGNLFEKNTTTGEVTKYYYAEGRRIAMRKVGGANPGLSYLLSDHLGGTVGVVDANGGNLRDSFYYSYGGSRLGGGGMPTDRQYTGQTLDNSTGLYFYGARFYDASLGRFVSPDTIVPDPRNPQSLNRYSYVYNSPLKYVDPTGHNPMWPLMVAMHLAAQEVATDFYTIHFDPNATEGQRQKAMGRMSDYAMMFAVDGPLPVGDSFAISMAASRRASRLARSGSTALEEVRHAKALGGDALQGFLSKINPGRFSSDSRFGEALYLAQKGETAVAEVMAGGVRPSNVIRYELDLSKANILDLTDSNIANEWGYAADAGRTSTQDIAARAQAKGYNAIKFWSTQGPGYNYALFDNPINPFDFENWIRAVGVAPAAE